MIKYTVIINVIKIFLKPCPHWRLVAESRRFRCRWKPVTICHRIRQL